MSLKNLHAGLCILLPYYDCPAAAEVDSDGLCLTLPPTSRPLSSEDTQAMVDAEWFQEKAGIDISADYIPEFYDPAEGWSCLIS